MGGQPRDSAHSTDTRITLDRALRCVFLDAIQAEVSSFFAAADAEVTFVVGLFTALDTASHGHHTTVFMP